MRMESSSSASSSGTSSPAPAAAAASPSLAVVDLDAVLDEFETHEERLEQQQQEQHQQQQLQDDLPEEEQQQQEQEDPESISDALRSQLQEQEEESIHDTNDCETLPIDEAERARLRQDRLDQEDDDDDTDRSSSPTFTSIYDDTPLTTENLLQAAASSGFMPTESNPGAAAAATSIAEEQGARPKESSSRVPIPQESPPPYSEVDPLHPGSSSSSRRRPNELQLNDNDEDDEDVKDDSGDLNPAEDPGSPGRTPNHASANQSIITLFQGLTEEQLLLGKLSPHWIPDEDAVGCMICEVKFTFVRRRHHCRACGKVLCAPCCSDKAVLKCLGDKVGRVCKPCKSILQRLERAERLGCSDPVAAMHLRASGAEEEATITNGQETEQQGEAGAAGSAPPGPNMPVGVLKRLGSSSRRVSSSFHGQDGSVNGASGGQTEVKQVMFSDGIRPGGDLADLDGSSEPRHSSSTSHRRHRRSKRSSSKTTAEVGRSLLSDDRNQLPLIQGRGLLSRADVGTVLESSLDASLPFIVNKNLTVYVKLVNYAPSGKYVWNFRSDGLASVGQDEIVLLLVRGMASAGELERVPPREIFDHYQCLYEQAKAGHPVVDMSHFPFEVGVPFLDSTDYGGFLYIRRSVQSVENLDLPPSNTPHLFALLITKWEVPWARLFPIRLKLRLGAAHRYYPAPLWSVRERSTVYHEIGNTIMKLLIDFRNYSYSLPVIKGMSVTMENKVTTVKLPKERYRDIQRALLNSNDPVLALGACFATTADSHLVAVQADEGHPNRSAAASSDYETQAINIANKQRKATGTSFIVFNGALKSSSGLTAKSSIVEDGLMVQVSQDRMLEIRRTLEKMEDVRIQCGAVGAHEPDEVVNVEWVDKDLTCNAGLRSYVDDMPLDGVPSIRLHTSRDYVNEKNPLFIRWTEVFLLSSSPGAADPPDPMNAATALSKAACHVLVAHLGSLVKQGLNPIAIRINLDPDKVNYEAGSQGQALPQFFMNLLDDILIPIIHGETLGYKLCLELVFRILEC